ncbi:MAG: organic solvent tolerance protein, partial [Arcobacter sp.]
MILFLQVILCILEVSAPISYSRYFFDDYLYFNAKNEIILSRYNYDNKNGTQTFDSGSLIQNEIALEVASDLTRPYKDYIHTINLKAKYSKPKNIKKTGDLYNLTNNNEELKAFPILQKDENIKLSLNQSLYDTNSSKQ